MPETEQEKQLHTNPAVHIISSHFGAFVIEVNKKTAF